MTKLTNKRRKCVEYSNSDNKFKLIKKASKLIEDSEKSKTHKIKSFKKLLEKQNLRILILSVSLSIVQVI